ncbi:MAG: Sec-independent protein translocase protein TatB [Gammaproteobacteria bacterium]
MFDFGFGEIVVLALIALVVVGPEQIPAVARMLGNWVRQARTVWSRLNEDFGDVLDLESDRSEHAPELSAPREPADPPDPPAPL